MSTLKTDAIEAATGTNTDLSLDGKGTGVPDLAAGFKVGSVAGIPTASIRDDAVTLAKLAAGTDGELITWDASGDPAAVAVGTATHVLTSNGAGAAPTFQAAAGGAWTEISNTTVTGSPTYVEVTGLTTAYKTYVVLFEGIKPGTDDPTVSGLEVGDSGAYETGSVYYFVRQNLNSGASTYDGAKGEAFGSMTILESQGNAAGEGFSGYMYIWGSDGVEYPKIYSVLVGVDKSSGNGMIGGVCFGQVATVQTVTRLRFKFSSGTIASGEYTLYGINHS